MEPRSMPLTIKQKLIVLCGLAVIALSCAVAVFSAQRISTLNDIARVAQGDKVLVTRIASDSQALMTRFFQAMFGPPPGSAPASAIDGINASIERLRDTTERVIERRLPYLKPEDLRQALALGGDMARIARGVVAEMVPIGADDAALNAAAREMLAKASALAALHRSLDAAITEDLTTISDRVAAATDNAIHAIAIALVVALLVLMAPLILVIRDLATPVPATARRDGIGPMLNAARGMQHDTEEHVRLTAAAMPGRATRDRGQAAIDAHMHDFGQAIAGVMTGLAQSAEAMRGFSTELHDASRRTGESLSGAVDRATASASNLDRVGSAAERMAESIQEVTRQVTRVTVSVALAAERATDSTETVNAMADSAERIGDAVREITAIAGRTNLLARHAMIDPDAGESGTGFAMTAGEVKALATRTVRAAEDITARVATVQGSIGAVVDGVRDVAGAIGQVEAATVAIATALENQAAATRAISDNVLAVSQATSASVRAMDSVTRSAGRMGVVSQAVLGAAAMIRDTSDKLRTEITDFLSAMTCGDQAERRAYERIDGAEEMVTIGSAGRSDQRCRLLDISLGGGSAHADFGLAVGAEIRVKLPTGGGVNARVVRQEDGLLRFAFSQDLNSLGLIGEALAHVRARHATTGVAAG